MHRLVGLWNGISPRRRSALRAVAIAASAVAVVWGLDMYGEHQRADDDEKLVHLYCEYRAVSRAHYDGCVQHVTADEVGRRYDRNEKAAVHAVEWQSYTEDLIEESQGSPWDSAPR
jgi:hypothetical protein